ncbi:hypothetical protein [Micromonospora carbonacea]|uniref:hypothetical protein n=1 Tax=Micromonospora carbonacea TaxID=47853 RepID=UPI00114CD3BE|nr:hypothetical protein [Micromonospora carbonacea]
MAFILHLAARSFYSLSGMLVCVILLVFSVLFHIQGNKGAVGAAFLVGFGGNLIFSSILSRRIETAAKVAARIREVQGGPKFE